MSSSNFGNCPVPKNEFALAINGGINSVYPLTPVFVSKKKLYKDLSNLAPLSLYKVNLEPVILAALSKSNIPKSVPISQWALKSKSNFLGSPHFLSSILSASVSPWGTFSFGTLGILSNLYLNSSWTFLTFSSSTFILSDNSLSLALSALTSFPSFISWGIFLDSIFISPFITSTSFNNSLLSSSNAITASRSNSFSPLLSIAFLISSKFSLILLISNISFLLNIFMYNCTFIQI